MRNSHENKHKPYLHLGPPILKPKFDLPGSQSQLSAQLQPLLLIWVRTLLEHPSLPILYFKLFAKPTNKQIRNFNSHQSYPSSLWIWWAVWRWYRFFLLESEPSGSPPEPPEPPPPPPEPYSISGQASEKKKKSPQQGETAITLVQYKNKKKADSDSDSERGFARILGA